MPVGLLHSAIRKVASTALAGFFREVHVIGDENVPRDGPLIVVCTHHNMMIDPTVLCESDFGSFLAGELTNVFWMYSEHDARPSTVALLGKGVAVQASYRAQDSPR